MISEILMYRLDCDKCHAYVENPNTGGDPGIWDDKEEAKKIRELQKFVAILAGISLDYTWYSIKYKSDTTFFSFNMDAVSSHHNIILIKKVISANSKHAVN